MFIIFLFKIKRDSFFEFTNSLNKSNFKYYIKFKILNKNTYLIFILLFENSKKFLML